MDWLKKRLESILDNLIFAGVVAVAAAIWAAIKSLPLPWIIGISGGIFVLLLFITRLIVFCLGRRSTRIEEAHRTAIEDIKSDLVNMSMYQREVAIKKGKQVCSKEKAMQIYDDFIAFFGANQLTFTTSLIQRILEARDVNPLIDFFKKFGDILDNNDYGLKVELESHDLYKTSRLDLAQKRLKLKMIKKKKAIIQKNIDRVSSLTYGLNSSILLRSILSSVPEAKGIVPAEIRITLEGIETATDKILNEMLNDLENKWKVTIKWNAKIVNLKT